MCVEITLSHLILQCRIARPLLFMTFFLQLPSKMVATVPLNYNFTFTRVDTLGATTKVGVRSVEYTQLVCSTHVTRVDIPNTIYTHGYSKHNLHVWIFHAMYTRRHARVFMALLFYVCITSSNYSLSVTNFTKHQHKYHTFTIPTIT